MVAVGDGAVVLCTDDGVLVRTHPDGGFRWSMLVEPPEGPPALDAAGAAYVASREGHLFKVDGGWMVWRRALGGVAKGGVAVGADAIAVTMDGAVEFFAPGGRFLGRVAIDATPVAPPATDGQRFFIPARGELIAVTPRGIEWRAKIGNAPLLLPAVGEAITVAATDGSVVRIERSGAIRWRIDTGRAIRRGPTLDSSGGAYVLAGDDVLAVDASGAVRWRHPSRGRAVGRPLVANGSIYVAVDAAQPFVLALSPAGATLLQKPLPAAPTRGPVLLAGGVWAPLADRTVRAIAP